MSKFVWIAFEIGDVDPGTGDYPHRLVGVFKTAALARAACAGVAKVLFAEIAVGKSYREQRIDWVLFTAPLAEPIGGST